MGFKLKLVLLLFCFCFVAISQNFTSRVFSTDQGLPDTYIYSVLQDKEGFLWIATGKGLVKFDGQVFSGYDLHANAQDDIIYSGTLDANDDLWFGTFSGKIYKLDKKNNRLKLYPKNIQGSVNKIIASKWDNRLYFFSKGNGIYLLKKNQLELITVSQDYQVNSVEEIDSNTLLIGTSEGLFTLNVEKNEAQLLDSFEFEVSLIQTLYKKKNTYLVSVPNKGILQIEIKEGKSIQILKTTDLINTVFPEGINSFCFNEETKDLYFGTRTEAFACINLQTNKIKIISENNFQANVNSVFIDKEFNIWATTTGQGLYRFFRTEFDLISLNNESVFAIAQDTSNLTYFGTRKGIVVCDSQGEIIKRLEHIANKELGKINALYCDKQNKLWIGTDEKGLLIVDALTQKAFDIEFSGIENISINAINGTTNSNEIQVCTNLDGVYNYSDYKLVNHFSVQNSLLHNNVYYSLKSKAGKIYYATHNTAFDFSQKEAIYEINIKDNGLISDFNSFAESADGTVMIGTNGDGVYKLNDTMIHPFIVNNKLGSKYCKGLVYDNDQNLWMMMGKTLYKYYAKDTILKEVELGKNNASVFNPNSFYKSKHGDLYFGTNNYVIFYDHNNVKYNSKILPHSYILSLRVNDSLKDISSTLELKNGKYNFKFEYSALSLKNSEELQFKYLLEGRDDNWSEPTKSRKIEFSNLADGSYTFKVLAINSEGFSETEPAAFSFIIKKPFWKTILFWISVISILIVSVLLIIKTRTASLVKAKVKLEAIVAEKTKELREEKDIVEQSNKIIEEQNHEIKDSITYAKRIQDALLPGKEFLISENTNVFVLYQPRDIVSGDFYWIADINGLKLVVAADCTGHGVPGALMSMIGTTLLNKIILEKKITRPKKILEELNREIQQALKQHTEDATRDGMDLCLCCIDSKNKKLIYAGAMRPLFSVRNNELMEYTPTKHAIGGFSYGKEKEFEEIIIDTQKNDMFYLFSDGYADQFGGEKSKKFMLKNFKKILVSISETELTKQEETLKRVYNDWKGSLDQVDDVLVIGVRI